MSSRLEAGYAVGRLAFGAAALAAPGPVGDLLMGDDGRVRAGRIMLRFFGSRDTVLGVGMLRALARDGDVDGWLAMGVMSDMLDTTVQLVEWNDLPPDKRIPGVLFALGAAATGAALLARRA